MRLLGLLPQGLSCSTPSHVGFTATTDRLSCHLPVRAGPPLSLPPAFCHPCVRRYPPNTLLLPGLRARASWAQLGTPVPTLPPRASWFPLGLSRSDGVTEAQAVTPGTAETQLFTCSRKTTAGRRPPASMLQVNHLKLCELGVAPHTSPKICFLKSLVSTFVSALESGSGPATRPLLAESASFLFGPWETDSLQSSQHLDPLKDGTCHPKPQPLKSH